MSAYPEDELDVAGRDRSPEGVHREVRPVWRMLLPYALVVVLVPLLALGAFQLIQGGDGGEEPTAAPETTQPTDDANGADNGEDGDNGEESPAPEETDTDVPESPEVEETTPETDEDELPADVITSTTISVLNGAGISGLAGEAAAQLQERGFTAVTATDYTAGSPADTTLYYRHSGLAATAEAVGSELGITNLVELASATQNVEIAIVLRADFAQ